jgi:hypothetical protein
MPLRHATALSYVLAYKGHYPKISGEFHLVEPP